MKVVGVRFRPVGQIYFFEPKEDETYLYDQCVVVESQQNKFLAYVAIPEKELSEKDTPSNLKQIIRIATENDLEIGLQNEVDAQAAMEIGKEKIEEHSLDMKIIQVDITFDRNKYIFYFTADGRIDFRELVKDLAGVFRSRIELRQVGVRDEAKVVGGIGPCGRPLCCASFLGSFMPVSIKMAKDQNLSLNPIKISGLCGRLMCCLKYESDAYEAAKKELPDRGAHVKTPDGKGRVSDVHLLTQMVRVRIDGHQTPVEYHHSEITIITASDSK